MNFAPAGWGLLLVATAWSLQSVRNQDASRIVGWKWWALIAIALFCFRWPLLWVPHQQNPDESQLIAGAITLWRDPVFWRSVDGGTAGPLDYFPLLPVVWGDGPASYAIARAIALAVVFETFVFAGAALAIVGGAAVARLAVLPAVAFYAFTTHPDFNHYSTELMPALLLAAAGYAAVRHGQTPSRIALWSCALLIGSVPWAKLQAVPLAGAVWSMVALREIFARRARSLAPLIGGALIPAVMCFGAAALAGQTEHLIVPFFQHNLAYIHAPQFTWFQVAALQWGNARLDGFLALWLAGSSLVVLLTFAGRMKRAPLALRQTQLVALLLFAAGILSALGPRRPSAHHLHLIVLPLIWLTGAALAVALVHFTTRRKQWIAAVVFLTCCLAPPLVLRALPYDPFRAFNTSGVSNERVQLAALVRALSKREEPLAMWGWRCSLYVEAGRPQATRQAHTEAQIYPGPLQAYFLRRYFEDFQASNAAVFADAVGPGNFAFEQASLAHEAFPPLREFVREHYTLVATLDGTRVYARNDRLSLLKTLYPPQPSP